MNCLPYTLAWVFCVGARDACVRLRVGCVRWRFAGAFPCKPGLLGYAVYSASALLVDTQEPQEVPVELGR